MSLQEQIQSLTAREDVIKEEIATLEESIKKAKSQLTIIGRAKKSLNKLQGQLNESTDISS